MKTRRIVKRGIALALALLVLSPLAVWAESATAQPTKGRRYHKSRGLRLNLSREQQDQMRELRKEYRSKFQDTRKSGDPEKGKELHKEFMNDAQKFLTTEQYEKMVAHQADMRKRWKNKGPILDLSDEQREQMKKLRETHRKEMKALRDKHQADIKKILTPEQIEKWEAWRKDKGKRRAGMRGGRRKKMGDGKGRGCPAPLRRNRR